MNLTVRYKSGSSTTTSYLATYPLVTTKPASYALGIRYDNTNYYAQLERGYTSKRPRFYIDGKYFRIATESYDPVIFAKTSISATATGNTANWTKQGTPTINTPGVLYLDGSSGIVLPPESKISCLGSTSDSTDYEKIVMQFYFRLETTNSLPMHLASFECMDTYTASTYVLLYIDESKHLSFKIDDISTLPLVSIDTVTIQTNKEYYVDLHLHSKIKANNTLKLTVDGTTTTTTPYTPNTSIGICYRDNRFFIGHYRSGLTVRTFITSGASLQYLQGYIREAHMQYTAKNGSTTTNTHYYFYFGG